MNKRIKLLETISPYLRRRLSFDSMKDNIDSIVDYELNPCGFSDKRTNHLGMFMMLHAAPYLVAR